MTVLRHRPLWIGLSALLSGTLACASLGGDLPATEAPDFPTPVLETDVPEPTEEDAPTDEPTEEEPTEAATEEQPTEVAQGDGDVLFEDDFEVDNERWTIGDEGASVVSIHDGVLDIEILEPQYMGWSHLYDDDFSDVRIAFDVEPRNEDDQPSWGVVCNYSDSQNFLFMSFGADGLYGIARYLNDEYAVLSDEDGNYIESELIEKGKSSYHVEAVCANGEYELYVDGKRIASVEDDALTGGTVGLLVETFDGDYAQALFDNVVVTTVD